MCGKSESSLNHDEYYHPALVFAPVNQHEKGPLYHTTLFPSKIHMEHALVVLRPSAELYCSSGYACLWW
jgi:hypothetical protein